MYIVIIKTKESEKEYHIEDLASQEFAEITNNPNIIEIKVERIKEKVLKK